MPTLKELLGQQGGASARFDTVGRSYSGVVIGTDVQQSLNYTTKLPETWGNGDPILKVVVTIRTDILDPDIEGDDGHRSIYVKWYGQNRTNFQAAVQAAGAEDIEPGGTFTAWLAEERPSTMGSPAKILQFEYKKPSPTAALLKTAAPTNGAATPAAAPTPSITPPPAAPITAAPAAAPGGDPVATVRQLSAAGLTPAQIVTAMPTAGFTIETIAAILNVPF